MVSNRSSSGMKRLLQIAGTVLLIATVGLGAQKGKGNNPKPPKVAAKVNGINKNPEAPKHNGAPKLGAPGNPVERLMAMPPEQRERVLEKLRAGQQANLRQRLERFDKLPPEERARLNRMFDTFRNLPPEKQAIVARQMQAFNNMPDERRAALAPVLQRLRRMPEDERHA